MRKLLLCCTILLLLAASTVSKKDGRASTSNKKKKKQQQKQTDPNITRADKLFFLQDPKDGTCLGRAGFGACDGSSAWVMADRKEGKALVALLEDHGADMCLERKKVHAAVSPVGMGPCSAKGAKQWDLERDAKGTYRLSQHDHKNCLVRAKSFGRKRIYKNTAEMRHCTEGYTGLQMQSVPFGGFHLQAADGYCFDGVDFRACDPRDPSLLWGIGLRFNYRGNGERFLYKLRHPDQCLVKTGKGPQVGECSSRGAMGWSVKGGQLAYGEGKWCIVRLHSNQAALERCDVAFEHLIMDTQAEAVERPSATGSAHNVFLATQPCVSSRKHVED